MTPMSVKSCVVLLGASEYPLYPALNVASARSSATALKDYFISARGLQVAPEDFLDLFGSQLNNTDQLLKMSRHIERFNEKCEKSNFLQNVFFIYIGHGIPHSKSISLAIASTSKNQPHITSLKVSDFADEIKKTSRMVSPICYF
ncbi:hypothetical protein [Burkholderia stagnalis]|uniref:Caspase family protein n=1 Tax=Burkholderia stagnalis TaxID=1503054 RepID=A0A6L3N3K0_9BURK|nr:hypothetical protein [Burkholderia stagnalis]KAB0639917.1 hypothetical protein F7R25_06265 [Burkholderia stagnalis]